MNSRSPNKYGLTKNKSSERKKTKATINMLNKYIDSDRSVSSSSITDAIGRNSWQKSSKPKTQNVKPTKPNRKKFETINELP